MAAHVPGVARRSLGLTEVRLGVGRVFSSNKNVAFSQSPGLGLPPLPLAPPLSERATTRPIAFPELGQALPLFHDATASTAWRMEALVMPAVLHDQQPRFTENILLQELDGEAPPALCLPPACTAQGTGLKTP